MKLRAERRIGAAMACIMLCCSVMSNFTVLDAFGAGERIDIWDMGGVAEKGALYENHISVSMLDKLTAVGDGSDPAVQKGDFAQNGDVELDGIVLNAKAKDRLYYSGKRNKGSQGKEKAEFKDGYRADGMYYANGAGSEDGRYIIVRDVKAGDGVSVYAGASNNTDTRVHFSRLDGEEEGDFLLAGGESGRADFVALNDGDYKLWFGADGGKPVVNRVVKYPGVEVSGKISGLSIKGGEVWFKNKQTGAVLRAEAGSGSYSARLTPNYTYTAVLSGIKGVTFSADTREISVTENDIEKGLAADLTAEVKKTAKISGQITGFKDGMDLKDLKLVFTPAEDAMTEPVEAKITKNMRYGALLDANVDYTAGFEGVNDYQITDGGKVNIKIGTTQPIAVGKKPVYSVSGSFVGAEDVKQLKFINTDDNYEYPADINGNTYTASLREGTYLAQGSDADGCTTRTHIAVKGDTRRDLFFNGEEKLPVYTEFSNDIYVGKNGGRFSYDTLGEAVKAAKAMRLLSGDRINIHIAPGIYREQVKIDVPYLSLIKDGEGDAVLTWYYGIGYKYYSIGKDGFFDPADAFDGFEKNIPAKWGVGTFVTADAYNFRAEGITFEASFNKYVTDEEIKDGAEVSGVSSIKTERMLGMDARTKAATERSTAIAVESDDTEFYNCTFIGSQDTLYIGGNVTNDVYFKNCTIEGNTDYIFGSGDAVFDACELRFCGYTDKASGGYITAARSNNYPDYHGYLFRGCTITNKSDTMHEPGYFGRPWDVNAAVYFYNTKLQNKDAIKPEGWTSMSGVDPDKAHFSECGTTYAGKSVSTKDRTKGTVKTDVPDPAVYFGEDWTPMFYTAESGSAKYSTLPYFSTDGDVAAPATGDTFRVKYSLGDNSGADATRIDFYAVSENGEEFLKTVSAAEDEGIVLTNAVLGKKLKAVVTPILLSGTQGESVTLVTDKTTEQGSGYREAARPSGKSVIFLAGDSTVKDYSEGAVNNSGANRVEGSWGEFLGYFIDNSKYEVIDYAEGGRSSRTFIDGTKADGSDRFLDKIKKDMGAGDHLFIQFGHNDSSEDYADRYVPVGKHDANGIYPLTAPSGDGKGDGSFKWYLQQFIDAAKAVDAVPVLVTPVSRMYFAPDGTVRPHHGANDEYVAAVKQLAQENDIECIDMYQITKALYEQAYKDGGETAAARLFAYGEKTHHSKLGGVILAALMADKIENGQKLSFAESIKKPAAVSAADSSGRTEFKIWSDHKTECFGKNAEGVYDESVNDTYWKTFLDKCIERLEDPAA